MFVVFRFDAGREIGGGHAMRCNALMRVLQSEGVTCAVATRAAAATSTEPIANTANERLELDGPIGSEPAAMAARWPAGADFLAVDHYGWNKDLESACRPWARHVLSFDDLVDRERDCDFLVNPNPDIQPDRYAGLIPENCELLLGPCYAPLNEIFPRSRAAALERRNDASVERIYVNYGYTDPDNLAGVARTALDRLGLVERADIAAGAAIQEVASKMTAADLALGAAGSSSWERCCLGLPAVVSIAAENQKANADALSAHGAAAVLPDNATRDVGAVAAALRPLIEDAALRQDMARRAAALCDGLGVRRIAMALLPPITLRDGLTVTLRPAVPEDGEIMLFWQQHPKTRAYARNPAPPTRETHFRWLAERMRDPECVFNIVTHGGQPAGVLRLQRFQGSRYEVNILIDPERHARGIGRAALELARTLIPWAELHAVVLPGNAASHALFRGAGYEPRGNRYVSPPLRDAA